MTKILLLVFFIMSDTDISSYNLNAYFVDGANNTLEIKNFNIDGVGVWNKVSGTVKLPSLSTITTQYTVIYIQLPINTPCTITTTNWQLEEGSVATPFEQRPVGLELSLCQRYYELSPTIASLCIPASSSYMGGVVGWVYKQTKRTTPTITITANTGSKTAVVQQLTSAGCTFVPSVQATLVTDYITLTATASAEL